MKEDFIQPSQGKNKIGKNPPFSTFKQHHKNVFLTKPSLYLSAGGCKEIYPIIQKLLQALFPYQSIHWTLSPNLKEIDTYVIFFSCSYDVEEVPLLIQGIRHARHILENKQLKPDAHILVILYRDLKVAFPERKLQREKVMSELMTEEILHREAPQDEARIRIIHEFGTNNLQDSLQQLTGNNFYFELL
jgi:hypothetical protein